MNGLIHMMYPEVLKLAVAKKIPLIDLPNTFDPRFNDLYKSQIEPSAFGSSIIAKLISHVVNNHSFDGESMLYSCSPGDYKKSGFQYNIDLDKIDVKLNNPSTWQVQKLPDFTKEEITAWQLGDYHDVQDDEEDEDLSEKFSKQLKILSDMGFTDAEVCIPLLEQTCGDVVEVVGFLTDGN